MSGFLSKSKQKLEHSSKLSAGEFKALGSVLGSEKSLLTSHTRNAVDTKKAAVALDEWAKAEGPDLADIVGKVAKLLGNDLSKAEEEFAENLKTYRLYFKSLRSKEEAFSTLKKNKDSLQNKIDSTEKKLAKMNPENKDLANVSNRLQELKSEMVAMEQAVINDEAAVGDFRRQQSRAALLHKLGALCQLGEKMTIIGELGKLLVMEIRTDQTEPGHERPMYNSYDRTQQIYGEAQTCLHQVVFDTGAQAGGAGSDPSNAGQQLPVPRQEDFDHSYEHDQATERDAYEEQQAQQQHQSYGAYQPPPSQSQSQLLQPGGGAVSEGYHNRGASLNDGASVSYVGTGPTQASASGEQGAAPVAQESLDPSRSYQPLTGPSNIHGNLESEFAEAVNGPWNTPSTAAPPHEAHQPTPYTTSPVTSPQTSYQPIMHLKHPSLDGATDDFRDRGTGEVPPTVVEHPTNSSTAGIGGSAVPEAEPEPKAAEHEQVGEVPLHAQQPEILPSIITKDFASAPVAHPLPAAPAESLDVQQASQQAPSQNQYNDQSYTPSGDDLYGTGLYGEHQQQPAPVNITETPQQYTEAPAPPRSDGGSATKTHDLALQPSVGSELPSAPEVESPLQSAGPVQTAYAPYQTASPPVTSAPAIVTTTPIPPKGPSPTPAQPATSKERSSSYSSQKGSSPPAPLTANTPSSPTKKARKSSANSAAKHSSYNSKAEQQISSARQQQQLLESSYAQRSSIAYLNEPPNLEPPMKAPPPVTSVLPLPSTSPYFNTYANLRSAYGGNDIGQGNNLASSTSSPTGLSGGTVGAKPKGARLDSALGSRLGYDMKAVNSENNNTSPTPTNELDSRPLRQNPIPNINPDAVKEKNYSYAIKADTYDSSSAAGKKVSAGAFRRAPPSNSYFGAGTDSDGISPAQRLRDEWRASTYSTPMSTPAPEGAVQATQSSLAPASARQSLAPDNRDSMYNNDPANSSRSNYSHRTSAIDAPTDVLPNEDGGVPTFGGTDPEEILPLNVRKRSVVSQIEEAGEHGNANRQSVLPDPAPAYDMGPPGSATGNNVGFGGSSRYVTNLE